MGSVQKTKSVKKLLRSSREKAMKQHMRPVHIKRARARHLKNARQSCGAEFAEQLSRRYSESPTAEKRHQGRKR